MKNIKQPIDLSMYKSTHPSVRPSIYLPIYPSVRPFFHPINHLSIHPSIHPSVRPFIHSLYCIVVLYWPFTKRFSEHEHDPESSNSIQTWSTH